MARKRKRNVTPPAEVAVKQESASIVPKSLPQLPTDIIQCIFDAIESFEAGFDSTLQQQRIWVSLALVCRDWAKLVIPHRNILILPTKRSIKRFNAHAPKLLAAGMKIQHLLYEHESVPEELLLQLVPYVSQTLTSLTISLFQLQSKHVHALIKHPNCQLTRVRVSGDSEDEEVYGDGYSGDWWKRAYVLHRIPTLTELSLSYILIRGAFREFQASVLSPIRTLHLHEVKFHTVRAVEHFTWPLVYQLEHLVLTEVDFDDDRSLSVLPDLWKILGNKLLSLRIELNRLLYYDPPDCTRDILSGLLVLETLELDGGYLFGDCETYFGHYDDRRCLPDLPRTLQHCEIGPLNWDFASAYLERMGDPEFLPNLKSFPIINLYSDVRERHEKEVEAHNQALSELPAGVYRSFELR